MSLLWFWGSPRGLGLQARPERWVPRTWGLTTPTDGGKGSGREPTLASLGAPEPEAPGGEESGAQRPLQGAEERALVQAGVARRRQKPPQPPPSRTRSIRVWARPKRRRRHKNRLPSPFCSVSAIWRLRPRELPPPSDAIHIGLRVPRTAPAPPLRPPTPPPRPARGSGGSGPLLPARCPHGELLLTL